MLLKKREKAKEPLQKFCVSPFEKAFDLSRKI